MNAILSKDEIQALLQALESGQGLPKPVSVEVRDFNRPLLCSRDSMDELRGIVTHAAENISQSLSAMFGAKVQTELIALEQDRFDNFQKLIGDPCCIFKTKMEPHALPALVWIEIKTALAAVDRLLGGGGGQIEPRAMKPVEIPIVQGFVDKILEACSKAFENTSKFKPSVEKFIPSKADSQFIQNDEGVLSIHLGTGGDFAAGEIRIAIPFKNLPAFMQTGKKAEEKKTSAAAKPASSGISVALAGAPVQLSALMGEGSIELGDLLMLEPGDVVPLQTKIGDLGKLLVGGVPRFHTVPGVKDDRHAVAIHGKLEMRTE